jgi:orotate phosphoribosyltransferase
MHCINVREILTDCGCVLEGEFFFALKSNGRVSTKYINIDPLLTYPAYLFAIANVLMRESRGFTAIAGPAVGAIPLVYAAAEVVMHRFPDNRALRTAFAEKVEDGFTFDRMSFAEAVRGQRTIIVEDIGSRGDSARATGAVVEAAGGTVSQYNFIWIRDQELVNEKTMGAPVYSLINEPVKSWMPEEHTHWGKWPLVTDVGHPEKFPDYPGPLISVLT